MRYENRWTAEQLKYMTDTVDTCSLEGRRVPWDDIVSKVGHPRSTCQSMMSEVRTQRRVDERKARRLAIKAEVALMIEFEDLPRRKPKPAPLPGKPCPVTIDYAGHIALTPKSKLVFDQELRDRIRERGLTGGFFGDPMPGRSALDKMRAGVAV
jgi:hypothetical protein